MIPLSTAAGMQHNTIASSSRKCFSRHSALRIVFPGSCRQFSHRKPAISTPSFLAHHSQLRNAYSISAQSIKTNRRRQEDRVPSVACTTLTTPDPASSLKSFCTSSLGATRHHTLSLNYNNHFSLHHRQIRLYTKSRSYTSRLFADKNGSAVGAKTAGTRVLLLIGSVVVLWFVLNYAIGAAIMMLLKGFVKMIWGALWWIVGGVLGMLRAVFGL